VSSLSITQSPDGEVLVHCFAGCEYQSILEALNGVDERAPKINIKKVHIKKEVEGPDAKEWWVGYTQVPLGYWEEWGTEFTSDAVIFKWKDLTITKRRKVRSKEFSWMPSGSPTPPLWPYPEEVAYRIFLCEGESDTGVLRHLGLIAFSMTKGANTPLGSALFALRERGVRQVVAVLDADSGGAQGLEKIAVECVEAGLDLLVFPTYKLVDPLAGEKDLRDYWLRTLDVDVALDQILSLIPSKTGNLELSYVTLDKFMATQVQEDAWLIKDVWLDGTIGVIAGAPKMYKSWLAIDLALSIASGTKFLGSFEAPEPGPVVIVPKEDPNFLLQDRISKIMTSKGLGGIVNVPHLQFPERGLPLYLDLTREFLFSEEASIGLFEYLRSVADRNGRIRAVVFDPILRMLPNIDEYKASEVSSSVFMVAARIQKEFQAAVILVHHRSKGGADTGKRSYGSIAFHAFSESSLYLRGEEPDQDGWVEVQGEYKSSEPTYWAYRFPGLKDGYTPEVRRREDAVNLHDSMLNLLEKIDEGLTAEELLSGITGSTDFLIRKTLKQLQEEGNIQSVIERNPKGGPGKRRWRLA
jgi:hypothetical protein